MPLCSCDIRAFSWEAVHSIARLGFLLPGTAYRSTSARTPSVPILGFRRRKSRLGQKTTNTRWAVEGSPFHCSAVAYAAKHLRSRAIEQSPKSVRECWTAFHIPLYLHAPTRLVQITQYQWVPAGHINDSEQQRPARHAIAAKPVSACSQ